MALELLMFFPFFPDMQQDSLSIDNHFSLTTIISIMKGSNYEGSTKFLCCTVFYISMQYYV